MAQTNTMPSCCSRCVVKGRCTSSSPLDSDEPNQHDGEDMDDLVQRSEEEFETYSEALENEVTEFPKKITS